MTTYDLTLKYHPILTDQIVNLIDNIQEKNDNEQLQLEAKSTTQEMNAEIENNSNHKCFPSGEEE